LRARHASSRRGRNARTVGVAAVGVLAATVLAGCIESVDAGTTTAPASTDTSGEPGDRCLVRLHGKGSGGSETVVDADGVANISPDGNAEAWGARQWLYFPNEEFESALANVTDAVVECDTVILNGFSNGAAFAAKLYCRGENLDGRLIRVVVDDPVPDAGVVDCDPDPSVGVVLYWTGGLDDAAQPGWDCGEGDWTCEGGTTIGIDAFAEALGTEILESPHDSHDWYWDAPELSEWSWTPDTGTTDTNDVESSSTAP
jgi:hypothetical protein